MLRIGLTGDVGSGKSTVARLLAERGAVVVLADELARRMMQPGEPVYAAIVRCFGEGVVLQDGTLDRRKLAQLAFEDGRVDELNALVHPAVLAEQARQATELERERPDAVFVVESALIFTTPHSEPAPPGEGGTPWRQRFDRILMVIAPEAVKVDRFVARAAQGRSLSSEERAALQSDALRRLAAQAASHAYEKECTVIRNDGSLRDLARQVDDIWRQLRPS